MSTFPWVLLLLIGAVVAIVWIVRGRRPAPPPVGQEAPPMAAGWGRELPAQPTYPTQPAQVAQPTQHGMGGQVMGGLATGLAIGAGALAAQEIGRHMLGGDRSQHGLGSTGDGHAGGSAGDSSLARDAGVGAIGRDDTASWDDGGGSFGGDDGGGGGGGDS